MKWEDTFTEQIEYFHWEGKKCFIIAIICLVLTVLTAIIKPEHINAVQDINTLFCLSCIIFSTIGGIMGKQRYYASVNRRKVSALMDRIERLEKELHLSNPDAETISVKDTDTEDNEEDNEENEG